MKQSWEKKLKNKDLCSLHLPDCKKPFVIVTQERDEEGREVEVERCVGCGASRVKLLKADVGPIHIYWREYREHKRRREQNKISGIIIPYQECKHGVQNFNSNGNIIRCRKCEEERLAAEHGSKPLEGATI